MKKNKLIKINSIEDILKHCYSDGNTLNTSSFNYNLGKTNNEINNSPHTALHTNYLTSYTSNNISSYSPPPPSPSPPSSSSSSSFSSSNNNNNIGKYLLNDQKMNKLEEIISQSRHKEIITLLNSLLDSSKSSQVKVFYTSLLCSFKI